MYRAFSEIKETLPSYVNVGFEIYKQLYICI